MNKHVHCALIKAWADGEEIEYFNNNDEEWQTIREPHWLKDIQYRIKPKQPMYRLYQTTGDVHIDVIVKHFTSQADAYAKHIEARKNINWLTDWIPLPFKPKET